MTDLYYNREFLLMDKQEDNSAQEIQADLSEIERDLTLRHLLWESQVEWEKLSTEWTSGPFDQLNVDSLQKNVNRFTQTVYMLEKGNYLTYKLHIVLVITFILLVSCEIFIFSHQSIKIGCTSLSK